MDFEEKIRELHQEGTIPMVKAAEILGISRFQLKDILDVMGLVWPRVSRGGKYTIDGITDTLENHAKRYNTTVAGVRWSLSRGLPVEAKRFNPVTADEALRFLILRQQGNNIKESAKKVGRPPNTLHRAVRKFFPDGISSVNKNTLQKAAANESVVMKANRRA